MYVPGYDNVVPMGVVHYNVTLSMVFGSIKLNALMLVKHVFYFNS